MKRIASAALVLGFTVGATAQPLSPEGKIDRAFRFLLTNKEKLQDPVALKNLPQQLKPQVTQVFVPGRQTPEERYDCIIYTSQPQLLKEQGVIVQATLPGFVTAFATLDQIQQLSTLPAVRKIEAPQFETPNNDVAVAGSGAALLHAGKLNNTPYKGKGVIAAIFDTGIDWKHPDFRDPTDTTKSRILRIWDQTLTAIAGESAPAGFNYGVEYTQAQINNELDGTPTGYVRERDINGHGTHVSGTVAGNGAAIPLTRKHAGMAPEADIVFIKGGDGSFPTTNSVNACVYLQNLATQLGKPVVLNMSIGSIFGAHDGTRPNEIAVDNFTASGPGRMVAISAGNSNGSLDHNRLVLNAGGSGNVSFTVPAGTTGTDVFEYRLYVNDNSNVTATFTAPDGKVITATPNQSGVDTTTNKGFVFYLDNYTDPANNDRYIEIYISRNGSNNSSPAGTWTLGLSNTSANTVTIDGWLYYTNTVFANTILVNADNEYLTGSPGNATSAVTVAAFVGRPGWYSYGAGGAYLGTTARQDSIATFSSHGPRRDGVLKPEISATGQHVISAQSSNSAPTATDVVFPGRYVKNQGTSMSSPVVAGAIALMLQANPTATVAQIRNAIFSNASKDALTETVAGPTPNTTWGYGRLDVYKAVSSMFNCTPVDRKTYQYDASNLASQDGSFTASFTRFAVRFTPDITGKLGGAYFHTHVSKTALVMEVRTSNAGVPGTLLGTMSLPDTTVALYSWNYADLSSLNIPVTSGTDYFIVMYRDAASTSNWSLRRENTQLDNRSLSSADGGATWTNPAYDYKIRSVVYANAQLTNPLATVNSINTRDVNTSNQFLNANCQLIAQLTPSGTNPVSGTTTANVWIETGVPRSRGGDPFVARHYQLTPPVANSTGRVTLYFTQAEFTAFNNDATSVLDLPTGPADAAGKANLKIGKFPGSSSDGSGLPATYPTGATVIDPADTAIVWNADASRWEVTFDVNGFSGFIVQTKATVLPIVIDYFTGKKDNSANLLEWKVNCGSSTATYFEIERSADGASFKSIGALSATQARCTQAFTYTDRSPVSGANYYRIKMTEASGNVYYTNVVVLQSGRALTNGLYPTYIVKGAAVQVSFAGTAGQLIVNDATGKQMYSHTLRTGVQSISIPASASGVYFYKLVENNKTTVASGKLVVQ